MEDEVKASGLAVLAVNPKPHTIKPTALKPSITPEVPGQAEARLYGSTPRALSGTSNVLYDKNIAGCNTIPRGTLNI